MSIIDDILAESEQEFNLGLEKEANDPNGAPQSPNNNANKQDITSVANAFLQEVEQFKAQLGQNVAGGQEGQQVEGEQQVDPNQQQVDPNQQQQPQQAGGATIQTPGGTIIKLASMGKLASLFGKKLFEEVE